MPTVLDQIGQHKIISTLDALSEFVFTPVFALDIETSGNEKLPADSPNYAGHGIYIISLANTNGDAVAILINDNRDYGGIPVADIIRALNQHMNKTVVFHHGKFDLAFLCARGLQVPIQIHDTYVASSMLNKGVYKDNGLKARLRELGVQTKTEEALDKYFLDSNTKDYGDLPPELICPYACDDVRYTLFLREKQLEQDPSIFESDAYKTLIKTQINLILAENQGVQIDIKSLKAKLEFACTRRVELINEIRALLGSVELDLDNEQHVLKYLHQKGMHSEPRPHFDEIKYVLNTDFISVQTDPLPKKYLELYKYNKFIEFMSLKHGKAKYRITNVPTAADPKPSQPLTYHPQYYHSIAAKGGLAYCKKPDYEEVELSPWFTPQQNHVFINAEPDQLALRVAASYFKDTELQNGSMQVVAMRTGLPVRECNLLFDKLYYGYGKAVFELKLKANGIHTRNFYEYTDNFALRAFNRPFKEFKAKLDSAISTQNGPGVQDRGGRLLHLTPDLLWKSQAVLWQSSVGSLMCKYLNTFSSWTRDYNGHLAFIHKEHITFSVPEASYAPLLAKLREEANKFPVCQTWRIF